MARLPVGWPRTRGAGTPGFQSTSVPAEWEGVWEFTRLATLGVYLAEGQKAGAKVNSRRKWHTIVSSLTDLSSCTPRQLIESSLYTFGDSGRANVKS